MEFIRARSKEDWKRIVFAIVSPLLAYMVIQMKEMHFFYAFTADFLGAMSFYFGTRDYKKFRQIIYYSTTCLLAAHAVVSTYVACVLVAVILNSMFRLSLDYEQALPHPVINSILFLVFKYFNKPLFNVVGTSVFLVGMEYYLCVEAHADHVAPVIPAFIMCVSSIFIEKSLSIPVNHPNYSFFITLSGILFFIAYLLVFLLVKCCESDIGR